MARDDTPVLIAAAQRVVDRWTRWHRAVLRLSDRMGDLKPAIELARAIVETQDAVEKFAGKRGGGGGAWI